MDGLARAIGAPVPVEFDGATLLVEPLGLREIGILEQLILKQRGNPISTACKSMEKMPPDVQERLMRIAVQESVKVNKASSEEVTGFINSREGLAFIFWLSARTQMPGKYPSHLDVLAKIDDMSTDEAEALAIAVTQASGIDPMGNSTGQTPEANPGLAKQTSDAGLGG